jgi:hypothetical protein
LRERIHSILSAASLAPGLTRLAILAVTGATALSVAACGTSNKQHAAPSASPTSSPAPAKGKAQVTGLIASVSGSTIQVKRQTGTATVDFIPSTKVTEVSPAQLTDVTVGSCVTVQPTRESAEAAITAQSVRISPAVGGKCPPPEQPAASATTAPSAPSATAPAKHPAVRGTVASVAGNTITVTSTDASDSSAQTTVHLTDKTKYTKLVTTDARAITQGKCITARGTTDSGGALQATTITVRPATNGKCPEPGGQRHAHGG